MSDFNGLDIFKKSYDIYNRMLNDVAKKNNLTLNQLKIILFLESNSKNSCNNIAKNIVEGLGATKSHISMSISDLEKNGFIKKIQDENDKKKSRLQLTKKADQIISEGKETAKRVKNIMFEGIEKSELEALYNVTNKVKENLEKFNN